MSAADMEVANYLAQRKAKKSNVKGGAKFRTFTAATAFMAGEGGAQDSEGLDGDYAAGGSSGGADYGSSSAAAAGGAHPSSANHHQPTPTAATLVAGEWIDDESPFVSQPRLMTGGVQVADLESLDLTDRRSLDVKMQQEDTRKQFHNTRQTSVEGSGAENAGVRSAPINNGLRRAAPQNDFPTLAPAAAAPAPVASVWGKVDRNVIKEEKKESSSAVATPVAAKQPETTESKPNVWRPKSQQMSSADSGSSATRNVGSSTPSSAAAPRQSAVATPTASAGPDSDGLKRASNPWKPRRGNE